MIVQPERHPRPNAACLAIWIAVNLSVLFMAVNFVGGWWLLLVAFVGYLVTDHPLLVLLPSRFEGLRRPPEDSFTLDRRLRQARDSGLVE